ncbi:WecB/TagA/CpsF family glycosyltransferase [Aggregatilinea lenta]|uniref:WecB/TagA/CpsF family glycosyltransferase n=1 Tax=Aggregatilinea lenta TaxID=913108 RepID=UPI000E5BFCF8|nr:WecB/TagA/CpsF family glycosyltransferase [Aggregatilinea lenta]
MTAQPPPAPAGHVTVLGVPLDAITFDGLLAQIDAWIVADDGLHQVCTVSPEFVMIAQDDPAFMQVLREADLCVADGIGLLFAARYLGKPLPQRVTGSDGVPLIAERAAREGWSLYLLGAAPGVAERAAQILTERYPGLRIAGTYAGSPAPDEEADIVARVNASSADILLVAYGAPRQDVWIAHNRAHLETHVALGVGGTFDFIAGTVPRAPRWMQRLALEWLFRLIIQPWRWRRMLRLPRFVWGVLRHGEDAAK